MAACKAFVIALVACASRTVSAGPLNNLLADLTGQNSHHNATCLSDGHEGAHACGLASSFTAFFPDAASHQSDHFLPEISSQSLSGSHDVQHGDVHMDQFDQQSLLAGKRPKMFVSFEKKE